MPPGQDKDQLSCLERLSEAGFVDRVVRHADLTTWRLSEWGLKQLQCTQRVQPVRQLFRCCRLEGSNFEEYSLFE
eukprot:5411152-Lingulodinium_polyedra.AAC.1